jgi:2-C-methyl-D-erythritol 2,4-cyclodiphosphate synthase
VFFVKNYFIGWGFDVHVFSKKKKPLVLGGYTVPDAPGLEAVSDGDVLLHAVCDALLGAAGMGDIGDYFPPDDPKCKGIDSKAIAIYVLKKISKFKINNVDATIIADRPRLVKHKPDIVKSLETILKNDVNLKIKSKEGLNILGGKNAISCVVVASLKGK